MWAEELSRDPDREFLLDGIRHGFHIIDPNVSLAPAEVQNYHSATSELSRSLVESQITSEITEGHYLPVAEKPTIISAIGAILKPSGKYRLIHDCSRPPNKAVNNYATSSKFKYQSLDHATSKLTRGAFLAKVDLSNAYRSVRIHPSNYSATGLKWVFQNETRPQFLVDTRLPFGASRSPYIFNALTQSVRRMMARRGFTNVVVYLDDFLIIEPDLAACQRALKTLLHLLRQLGFHINYSKLEGPSQVITFLGVEIDSNAMSLSLPQRKLSQLADQLTIFSSRTRATCNQLQSLAGKLAWASRVVRGGRTFLRRILDTIPTVRRPSHKVKLTPAFQEDIAWWRDFIRLFNGTTACTSPAPITTVHVDACNNGSGIAYGSDWQYTHWRCDWPAAANLHINYKEALSFLIAARRWAHVWSNHRVIIHTDSTTAMAIINKGTCRNKLVMAALRELFWLSAMFNF